MMGIRNGEKAGWDAYTLDREMIEMLKPDCEDTAKKIETNAYNRWKEEHKQELDWYCESLTEIAYLAVIYSLSISTGRTGIYKQEVKERNTRNQEKTEKSIGKSEGDTSTSWADLMSPEDAAKYNNWVSLREAGLDQAKINDIILTNKGYRPNPLTYLSQEYINKHLELFSDGVVKITAITPTGQAGPPGGLS